MTAASQDLDFGILLGLGYQEFVRELRETVTAQGFEDTGRSDGYVLRSLAGRPMNISELAERLEITKQGAAQIVDDMQRRGYLERRDDPNDRRAKLLYPTARGTELLSTAKKFHRRYEQRLIRAHGAEAVAALRTLLGAIATEEGMADPRFHAFGM
ncbi:MarR family winged helix-turn-helix transcriptional regulator [Nocardia sp. NPDC051052]|uniref:MarR family winged helix-turn-helix transcriptional regulator n=1 Tax=Nocardia sp. NPDC051052 TaxID=3364322 RepID=UPI0037A09F59